MPGHSPTHDTQLPGDLAAAKPVPTSMSRWHPLLLALTVGALGLAAAGQYILVRTFEVRRDFPWEGLLVYLLAVLAFGWATLVVDRAAPRNDLPRDCGAGVTPLAYLWQAPWRLTLLLGATGCVLVLLYLLQLDLPPPGYNGWALLWVAALGLYLIAVAPPRQRTAVDWQGWLRTNWHLVLLMSGIVLVAFGVRFWQVGNLPPTLSGDEGSQGLEAIKVLKGEITNPFGTGWLGVPTMSFYLNALTIGPMGNTAFALRLPWVLVGTVTVLVTFWLVRRLAGQTLGLVTAALLAGYHYHIHFSRVGSNQIADVLFVTLALLFFYRGYDRRSPLDWTLCGMMVGVSQYFYAGARFTAIIIIALVMFFFMRDGLRFWREQRAGLLLMTGAALLSGGPMIQYAMRFPDDYNARLNTVGIFQSGWLEREQVILNKGALPILFDQFQRAALAFNYYPDRTVWYGLDQPLFGFVPAALFVLGFGYGLLNLHDRRIFPMVAWWGGAMIMGGMLTESPPSSQRLITMSVPAVFFVALALVKIGQVALYVLGTYRPRFLVPYLSAAVLLLSLFSVRLYFVEYTPTRVYGNYHAVIATALGQYAHEELGPDWQIFFFGAPEMYVGFGSIPYLAPEVPRQDVLEPLMAPPDWNPAAQGKHAAFVFLPARRGELALVQQAFPGGVVEDVPPPPPFRFEREEPLYTIYRVTREQLVQQR